MVHVMQQMFIKTKLVTYRVKQFRHEIEVFLRRPQLLFRPLSFGCGFISQTFTFRHAVGGFQVETDAPHVIGHDQLPHGMRILGRQNLYGQIPFAFGAEGLYAQIRRLQDIGRLRHHLGFNHIDRYQAVVADAQRVGQIHIFGGILPCQRLLVEDALEGFLQHRVFQRLKGRRVLRGGYALNRHVGHAHLCRQKQISYQQHHHQQQRYRGDGRNFQAAHGCTVLPH